MIVRNSLSQSPPEVVIIPVPTTEEIVVGPYRIPAGIIDLQSFREWTYSEEFPEKNQVYYLHGLIWVDLSMEQLYTHNQVKQEFYPVLGNLVRERDLGLNMPDGMRISNLPGDISTEPDGMFATYETFRSGRLREVAGRRPESAIEVEGTSDMVLEIVSDSSVEKDNDDLPETYRRAGIPEFWRVDAREDGPRFEILRLTDAGYVAVPEPDGWWRSEVFGRSFRLARGTDPLGRPRFTLEVRPPAS